MVLILPLVHSLALHPPGSPSDGTTYQSARAQDGPGAHEAETGLGLSQLALRVMSDTKAGLARRAMRNMV